MKKKSISILTAAVLLAVTLAGCGDKAPAATLESTAQASSETSETPTQESTPASVEESTPAETVEPETTSGIELLSALRIRNDWDYYNFESEQSYSASASYSYFKLADESAEKYPALAKALQELADINETNVKASAEEMKSWYDEYSEYGIDTDLEETSVCEVTRADSVVFAWENSYYSYGGGAHGYYAAGGAAIDTETGKMLNLGDVITDEKKFKEITAKYLDDTYGDIFFSDIYTTIDEYAMEDFTWIMDYFGIKVIFNPYELASYADGMQEVDFSFEEYPELIDEKYRKTPDKYIVKMTEMEKYYVDVNNDGAKESFSFSREYTGDGEYMDSYNTVCYVNGQAFVSNFDDYGADVYFVNNGNRGFIYLMHSVENDYSIMEILDLKVLAFNGNEGFVGNYSFPGSYELDDLDEWSHFVMTTPVFNNPDSFRLASRLDYLSTYDGTKEYHVRADGTPVTDDEFYEVNVNFVIKAIADVPCKLVNEAGQEVEKSSSIPTGAFVKIYRAGEGFVDLVLVDNYKETGEYDWYYDIGDQKLRLDTENIFRIEYEDDYSYLINGVDPYEYFEGLMYAG